jgi:uroporphyrin-3 C-methyltransferase
MTDSNEKPKQDKPKPDKPKPDKAKARAEKKAAKREARAKRGRRWPLLLTFLIAAGAAGASYYLWQEFNALGSSIAYSAQQTGSDIKNAREALEQRLQKEDDRIATLEQTIRTLQGKDNMDWLVSEAEYLMRIANYRLLLERDVKSALTALKTADARLFETNDPYWIPVRQQVARDITALEAVQDVDVAGLSVRLTALGDAIEQMPILKPERNTPSSLAKQETNKPPAKYWDEVWSDLKERLSKLIVIRSVDRPPGPLLEPDQAAYLQQNLQLKLEEVKLALLRGQAENYRDGLAAMKTWIETFYDTGNTATREVLKHLTALHEIQIDPPLPDISTSLEALKAARLKRAKAARGEGG